MSSAACILHLLEGMFSVSPSVKYRAVLRRVVEHGCFGWIFRMDVLHGCFAWMLCSVVNYGLADCK